MPKPNLKDRIDRPQHSIPCYPLLQKKCSLPGDTLDEQADGGYVVLQAVLAQLAKSALPDASGGDLSVYLHSDQQRTNQDFLYFFFSRNNLFQP